MMTKDNNNEYLLCTKKLLSTLGELSPYSHILELGTHKNPILHTENKKGK